MLRRTGPRRPRRRRHRWRFRAPTGWPGACGCEARPWPGGPGRMVGAVSPRVSPCRSWPRLRGVIVVARSGPRGLRLVGRAVVGDLAVEHLDAAVHAGRYVAVVSDDHDGHASVVQVAQEGHDGLSGCLVEV